MLESVLGPILNRYLQRYIEGLSSKDLAVPLWGGDIRLKNLKLKKEALDKFRLPIDVKDGYIGNLTLSIPWTNLKGRPVKVNIDNVYLLATPNSPDAQYDPEEDERRKQAAKMEKLESAELLTTKPSAGMSAEDEAKNEGFIAAFTNRIVDNLQISVQNVHIRYEDDVSVPGHPFSVGLTLGGFSATSTDKDWQPTFIHNSKEGVHKLAQLDSLSIYFDTDSESLAGMPSEKAIVEFNKRIAKAGPEATHVKHQFVMRPVSGEGRFTINHHPNDHVPKTDAELLFKELAFTIDEDQYRDALSMLDLFHFYTRKNQYRKYRPEPKLIEQNKNRALLQFAQNAILAEVKERHRRWTWEYFRQRRDDRKLYIYVFKLDARGEIQPHDKVQLDELERKLSYQDIRFYRSIARSELRKEKVNAQRTAQQKKLQGGATAGKAGGGGWLGWVWGGSGNKGEAQPSEEQPQDILTDDQRKELYDTIDFDESQAVTGGLDLPKDTMKLRAKAKLDTGSFTLLKDPHGSKHEMIKIVFDDFAANAVQRPDNLEAVLALGAMSVFDGTKEDSLHKQIVKVKQTPSDANGGEGGYLIDPNQREASSDALEISEKDVAGETSIDPFFFVKFEQNPLDGSADTALTVKLRYMEIIYHKGYVEEIVRFFKPPASQLESVNALVDAASSTLEGIRKETRAGLEFALQQHKTVDLRVDMNAPIIIVPEDVTKARCQHIVLDAGHISVESELVDKADVENIRTKQKEQYSEADFERLESLMYDRYHIKLEAAQLLMANTLEDCMEALNAESSPQVHILERINLAFKAETCIVATAPNLTRFRILGDLPDLHIHFSDRKYKNLMRMIDVALPKFDEAANAQAALQGKATLQDAKSTAGAAPTFRTAPLYLDHDDAISLGEETDIEYEDEEHAAHDKPITRSKSMDVGKDEGDEKFYDADDIVEGDANFRQKSFEFNFTVTKLQASIYKSDPSIDKPDKLLVDTVLEGFSFQFALRPYDMQVGIQLHRFAIDDKMVEEKSQFTQIVTSDAHHGDSQSTDLVTIKYARVQPNSPEFMTVHEGNNQSVDVELSTISLIVTRASILMLFDWIMTTFTGGPEQAQPTQEQQKSAAETAAAATAAAEGQPAEKLRVKVKLTEVRLILNDDGIRLATLSLQAADVAVLLRGPTMRVAARLGNLTLVDDVQSSGLEAYKRLLSIEGDNLADFQYEKYDPHESTYPGYDTLIYLRSGSFRFHFVEEPIHRILRFLTKFARMKAVYDAATSAAAQQASELTQQVSKMHYDVLVKTPILIFPRDSESPDTIIANLGEMSVSNKFSTENGLQLTSIDAALSKIRLSSKRIDSNGEEQQLEMLKNVDLNFDVTMVEGGEQGDDKRTRPDTEIVGKMSDVRMHLTAQQYAFLLDLSKTVPRTFSTTDKEAIEDENLDAQISATNTPARLKSPSPEGLQPPEEQSQTVDLYPELAKVAVNEDGEQVPLFSKLELSFVVKTVYLELFDSKAVQQRTLKEHSLIRFALNETDVKYKMVSNGSMEAEVLLRSFTVHDTRPERDTKFREIIPASKEKGYQLMVSYAQSGGADHSAVANVTIDTPSIIFSLDPLFALLDFVSTPSKEAAARTAGTEPSTPESEGAPVVSEEADKVEQPSQGTLAYRVNVVQASVKLLADPSRHDSEAIVLSIRQVQLAQQGTMVLSVDHMGIFLCKMDKQKETIRILDDFDLNLSMDNRQDNGNQVSNIELDMQALVVRLSNRDVFLVSSIVSRAIELSASPEEEENKKKQEKASQKPQRPVKAKQSSQALTASTRNGRRPSGARPPKAEVIVTRETLRASFGGLRLVLISDLHELPVLDFKAPRFTARVEDWSADMRAGVSITPVINYYNLTNSRWEALMDPWEFSVQATKTAATQAMAVTLASKKRLEVNVTHTFIELALNSMSLWSEKGDEVLKTTRGANAPFLMRNRTGHSISLWTETDGRGSKPEAVKIEDGADKPWRLDDWRAMRESATTRVTHNAVGISIDGTAWERIKNISVEREGELVYRLKPKVDKVTHRLLCEVKLVNNVKIVTFRSTFKVENLTLVPSELVIIDANGKKASPVYKLPPGEECSVPIEAAYHQRIKVRPDPGFGHTWCSDAYNWQDLVKRPSRTISCKSTEKEASFRFQAFADYDRTDPLVKTYPKLTLRLRAPIEVENLLPFDIRFRVYDKNREHNWSSFLRQGGTSPLHMAELSHLILLSVEVQDSPFKRSEFAIINTDNPDDLPVEDIMPIEDKDGLKMNLRLHYERYPKSGGAFKVQVYTPYVVYNKTGLEFALKSKAPLSSAKNVAGHGIFKSDHRRKEAIPFLFSYDKRDARNRALLRIADSAWSEPLSFETVGTETAVAIPSSSGQEEITIGMKVTEGIGSYKIIKVITFYPRFVVQNKLRDAICVRPAGSTYTLTLEPEQRQPLHWLRRSQTPQLVLSYPHINKWAAPFNMLDVGETHLRMRDANDGEKLLRTDIALTGAVVYLTISPEERGWPIVIENSSDFPFTMSQVLPQQGRTPPQEKQYKLSPHTTLNYAFDLPSQSNKQIRLVMGSKERVINIMEIGSLVPFKFYSNNAQKVVSLDVLAEGHFQLLRITNYDEHHSLFKLQRGDTSLSMSRASSQSSRDLEFEAKEEKSPTTFSVNLSLEGIGISVINRDMVELLYASFRGIRLAYGDSATSQAVRFSIKWIQIDNQLFGGIFPLLLYPSVIPRDGKELEVHPNLQVSVILLKDQAHGVLYFKYASVLLQEMTVEVDEDFLFALLDFSKFRGTSSDQAPASMLIEEGPDLPEAPQLQASTEVYFEQLELQPIQLDLSFMRTESLNSDQALFNTNRNAIAYFLNAVTMAIGNVNDAPIRLNALIINDVRLSFAVLSQRVMLHYQQEFINQLYRVLGSADFLGNPIGLFSNVSSGVADLFYEPTEGVVEFRDFGAGLARGAGSFVKKTVFGVTDSMTKVTGSIGKGLSAATLDKQFQSQRRMRQYRNKPRHALYGVAAGAGSLVSSVASGFEGLARKPIEGAEADGAAGFFRGIGKGVIGFATKPVVGVFDLASNVTEGIRNTTTVFDQSSIDKVRLPRLIPYDKVLRIYNEREALGQFWLKNLENGRFFDDYYIAHLALSGEKEEDLMVILTTAAIILAKVTKLKVMWHVPLRDLQTISLEPNGISLVLREGARGPFLALPEQESRLWLFTHIERVVNSHNAQRRVE